MRRTDRLETVWNQPPHTKAKHDLLRGYLGAWFGIMGNSPWDRKVALLDPFAGPGIYAAGEPGSPIVALSALLDHDLFDSWKGTEFLFLFNEADADRHQSLNAELKRYEGSRGAPMPTNVKIHTTNRTFGEVATELLDDMKPDQQLVPIFAFIDPFGFSDCSIELIKRLLAYPKAELLIYFDFNNINRFATAGNVDEHLTALFGTDRYKDAPPAGAPGRHEFLHDLYESQLKAICSFAHVRSFAMLNETGHVGNYLFFGTRNLKAFDKMKQSMWRVAPAGDFRFEDRLAGEPVLFEAQPDFMPLRHGLQHHFGGRTVDIQVVIDWVMSETPYHSGHVKVKTLRPMQSDGLITSPNQRVKGQFPAGTRVAFV